MTIVRIWRSVTLATKAEQYLEYLQRIVIPAFQTAGGNEGLFVLRELRGGLTHFLLLSFWNSYETLDDFIGTDSCQLVNPPPEEKSLLISFESTARHYAVVYMSKPWLVDNEI